VAAWKKHNPWVAYCAQRTKGIANKHSARASISVMLQRAEAQLLESTLAELDKAGVPYRTVLPLYDGALLLCETGLEAQLIQAVRAACALASAAMGMPEMQCTAGAGPSWGVAQK
jgi:hypothetical protein